MKKIAIVWTVTLLVIIVGLTVICLKLKKNNVDNIMEKSLVKQVERYLGLYPALYPALGESKTFTSDELQNEGYDANLDSECTGYVVVENEKTGFSYTAYIKCPNYVTEGYSEE